MALSIQELERIFPGSPEYEAEYAIQRIAWRARLSDVDCRAIAYEYRVAMSAYQNHGGSPPDDCLEDGWLEYKRRFGSGSPQKEFVVKPGAVGQKRRSKARKAVESRKRGGFDRISPLYDERGQLK